MAGFGEPPPDDLSLKDAWANILRGMTSKDQWQQVSQGAQNVKNVAPSVVESLARGSLAQIPGTLGDINDLIINHIGSAFPNAPKAPTTEQILQAVPRITPDYQGSRQHEMVGEFTGPALAKLLKTGAEVTKGMPVGNMIAYHGTPHEIQGAFDISKVGTGEGAQAYGHGMYFAEHPDVSEGYRISLSYDPEKMKIGGKQINDYYSQIEKEAAGLHPSKSASHYEKMQVLEDLMLNNFPKDIEHQVAQMSPTTQKWFEKTVKPSFETYGNLYKVDIPDEYIPKMLDWDKPLNEQPKAVQEALAKHDYDLYHPEGYDYDPMETGQSIYHRLATINAYGKPDTSKVFVDSSNLLNELGIKGIRYLDAGSRGESGTSNFVVFEPSQVKILEKNGQPVSRKEIIEEQINKLK